ncbi:hypothetical protein ABI014_15775, partial [Enterococcus faecium]
EGQISAQAVVQRLTQLEGGDEETKAEGLEDRAVRRSPRRASADTHVMVQGDSDVFTKLAKCCLPLPSDEIVGFVTRGDGIS